MEKIYAKIKEFARVTLATRKVTNDGNKVSYFEANSFGRDNSENHSHDLIGEHQLADTEESDPDTSAEEEGIEEEGSNVMSFSEFSDGPMPVSVDTSDQPQLDNDAGLDDIETSNKARQIIENSSNEVTRSGKSDEASRSQEARARSLWLVSRSRSERYGH